MRLRRSTLVSVVAGAAVVVLAVALLASRGPVEALVMIALVAVLTGMYLLRRYARAEVLYRRRPEPDRPRNDEPALAATSAAAVRRGPETVDDREGTP
jgi:hypothetical protein